MGNPAMYFRDGAFAANQDMYFKAILWTGKASFTRMDAGQIAPFALFFFAHQCQLDDGECSCTFVIAPAVAGMLKDPRHVLEIL